MHRPSVKRERTGWRDEALSLRHRVWGWDCPAADIDFLMIEYDGGWPKALVDYKAFSILDFNFSHPNIMAQARLAAFGKIPAMVVEYHKAKWWFRIMPTNEYARQIYYSFQVMSEQEFVASLYRIRGRALPSDIREALNDYKPREAKQGGIIAQVKKRMRGKGASLRNPFSVKRDEFDSFEG